MSQESARLDITVVRAASTLTVTADGELDLATEGPLVDRVGAEVTDEVPGDLILDLAGLRFCDSAGINALVRLRKLADHHGSRFAVVHVQPAVRRVLELTGLSAYLNLDGDPAA